MTVVDVLVPPEVHLGPFLVAAPAVTASFAGLRMTAFVGAVAVLAQALVAVSRTSFNDLNHTYQIIALFLISAFAAFLAGLREQSDLRLNQLRSVAEAAQHVVMRPLPVRSGPLRIASVYLAAEDEAQLGGDLYAQARTDDGTRMIVGDVRGKGLDAIGEAADVLGAFRALAHKETELSELVTLLDTGVAANTADAHQERAETADGSETFVTAVVIEIPDSSREIHLISCGHPPPLLLRGDRVISLEAREPSPPLGLGNLLAAPSTTDSFPFDVGDVLLLYTDGVIEARDPSGAFYSLPQAVSACLSKEPESLLAHLNADLQRHAGGHLSDDAAMVAIERLEVTAAPEVVRCRLDDRQRPDQVTPGWTDFDQ
ncbi:PP2C family protein-serine/threonine phosphatase [Streptomyces sp. NPDC051286]|uniref:PP2C family protein-serine/threonine phosphatase n=1 Tax=Streptomyces sp. NPDC051286 TaxID=3365647 RepID=UPI003788EB72